MGWEENQGSGLGQKLVSSSIVIRDTRMVYRVSTNYGKHYFILSTPGILAFSLSSTGCVTIQLKFSHSTVFIKECTINIVFLTIFITILVKIIKRSLFKKIILILKIAVLATNQQDIYFVCLFVSNKR